MGVASNAFLPLRGTNSKTTLCLMSYFLGLTTLNNTGKSSCFGPFETVRLAIQIKRSDEDLIPSHNIDSLLRVQ